MTARQDMILLYAN